MLLGGGHCCVKDTRRSLRSSILFNSEQARAAGTKGTNGKRYDTTIPLEEWPLLFAWTLGRTENRHHFQKQELVLLCFFDNFRGALLQRTILPIAPSGLDRWPNEGEGEGEGDQARANDGAQRFQRRIGFQQR